MNRTELLENIRNRKSRSGVLTADRYFRSIEGCFNGGFCPTKLFEGGSPEQWEKALKEAESQLTFCNSRTVVMPNTLKSVSDADSKGLAEFDCVITATKRDRDKDVLDSMGATLDPNAPLLFSHIPMQGVGALVKKLLQNTNKLAGKFVVAATQLGEDCVKLIEVGGLRISHGFDPEEFEPMDDGDGYHVKKYEIYEVSLVTVPSNTAAIITAFDRKQLKSLLINGMAKKLFDARPVQGIGVTLPDAEEVGIEETKHTSCTCQKEDAVKEFTSRELHCIKSAHEHVNRLQEMVTEDEHKKHCTAALGHLSEVLTPVSEPKFADIAEVLLKCAPAADAGEVNQLSLSLTGVAADIKARCESERWQEVGTELGLI